MNISGETITVRVENFIAGGHGLGRYRGKPIFIPGGVPGDILEVKVIKDRKSHTTAEIMKLIHPSSGRILHPCLHYNTCGGCDLQHIDDSMRNRYLSEIPDYNLRKITGLRDTRNLIATPIAGEKKLHYRIRASFKLSNVNNGKSSGFFKKRSHEVTDINECPVVTGEINRLFIELRAFFNTLPVRDHPPFSCEITSAGGTSAIFYFLRDHSELLQHFLKCNIFDYLEIRVENTVKHVSHSEFFHIYQGNRFRPGSFIQVNSEINTRMREFIGLHVDSSAEILDLFAGNGNLSLDFARTGTPVTAVELNRRSTQLFELEPNIFILEKPVVEALRQLYLKKNNFSTIILDPPRVGATGAIKGIISLDPSKIIYVSCDTATLARDIKDFYNGGYTIKTLQPFDMFPQTSHIETVTVLQK